MFQTSQAITVATADRTMHISETCLTMSLRLPPVISAKIKNSCCRAASAASASFAGDTVTDLLSLFASNTLSRALIAKSVCSACVRQLSDNVSMFSKNSESASRSWVARSINSIRESLISLHLLRDFANRMKVCSVSANWESWKDIAYLQY